MCDKLVHAKRKMQLAYDKFIDNCTESDRSDEYVNGAKDLYEQLLFQIDMEVLQL